MRTKSQLSNLLSATLDDLDHTRCALEMTRSLLADARKINARMRQALAESQPRCCGEGTPGQEMFVCCGNLLPATARPIHELGLEPGGW